MLTLDQLEILESVAQNGSFSAAAREMNRATSAISYGVKSMETALGIELFDRSGHRVTLSKEGAAILEETRAVLRHVHALERVAGQLREGWEPQLQVVVDGISPLPPIMRALKAFGAEDIPTKVHLMVEYLGGVAERFEKSEADLMLVLDFEKDAERISVSLPKLELVLLAHKNHPLARTKGKVDREALTEHVQLVVEDSSSGPGTRLPLHFEGPHLCTLSDFHSKREAIKSGIGFGWLPLHLAQDLMRRGTLVALSFDEGNRYTFRPSLVHRRNEALGRGGRMFLDHLLAEIKTDRRRGRW